MKQKVIAVFTILVIALTAFQSIIPSMPITNEQTITLLSAITLFLVSGLTTWKQALSNEIDNNALKPTLILAAIATLGGLNDLFSVIHLSDSLGQWLRFGITATTMILNVISKVVWPTPATKSTL